MATLSQETAARVFRSSSSVCMRPQKDWIMTAITAANNANRGDNFNLSQALSIANWGAADFPGTSFGRLLRPLMLFVGKRSERR